MRAIKTGIRLGADFIEIDVQRTSDGHLVVLHDKRVDRTTNGRGAVREMSLAEVRRLDAGAGECIPTFEEVLAAVDGKAGLMVELIAPKIAALVVATVRACRFAGPIIYASFLHAELLKIRDAAAEASTLALIEGVPVSPCGFADEARATHVGLSRDSAPPEFIRELQRGGKQVFIYTVNEPEDIAVFTELGVEGIITDHPERVK